MPQPPEFDDSFRGRLHDLLVWRRDVRHFRTDALPPSTVEDLIAEAALSPSVGHSQPWRFVTVDDPSRRAAVREDFLACNREALDDYEGERAKLYASLKLAGLDDAPVGGAVDGGDFVSPRSIAAWAAALMWSGVSKSGSPAPSPMTSRPAALSSAAFWVTAMVGEGLIAG